MSVDTQLAVASAALFVYGVLRPLPSRRSEALRRFRDAAQEWLDERVYPATEGERR